MPVATHFGLEIDDHFDVLLLLHPHLRALGVDVVEQLHGLGVALPVSLGATAQHGLQRGRGQQHRGDCSTP